ncbi:hypothetical protein Q8F55_002853 [Vanrija albida]|uniref:Major facilitator superfamily (MFS) profile domain-containing protein n=1 Tax=Vanrija albida TaxID=181172 RepID=A0ABR3QAY4_9TREE
MSDHEEKPHVAALGTPEPDPRVLRRALLKLDVIFLPAITIVYFLNFLDRSNIGNANAAGLSRDLGLTDKQYSLALTTTYIPYIVAELPLTLAIKKIGPHILIPTLVILWGLVTTFQGFIHNYPGLLAARFFLGATEGAILPSSMTYLSSFYRRRDLAKRVAFFFSATSLAGAFSGLLAAAIINMHGLGGKKGWQWIFIIEGLVTVVYGAAAFGLLTRSPGTTWYLTPEERAAVVAALDRDRPAHGEEQKLTLSAVLSALKAPQMWFMFAQFFASGVLLYSMAFFTPTIVGTSLGYKGTKVQLYSVPPYVCSAAFALLSCFLSDRFSLRGPFVILASLVSVIGYAIFLSHDPKNPGHQHALYAALFLQVMGAYTVAPLQSTWMPNNLAPFYRRVTGITMGFISTNSGGILSTWLFPKREAPHYKRGTSVSLGMAVSMIFWSVLNMLYLARENRKRAKLAESETEAFTEEDGELGDRSAKFKYIL